MKTFLLIIALLSITVASRGAGSFPIKNGVLQTDLNAGGKKLTNVVDVTDSNGVSLLGGGGGGGQTAGQVSAAILGGAIIQTNGTGTNTSLGTLTILQGSYKNYFLANGAWLRTNTAPPFDWEYRNTNGVRTDGTNTVTKRTFFVNGDITLPQVNGGTIVGQTLNISQSLLAGNGGFFVNFDGSVVTATGKLLLNGSGASLSISGGGASSGSFSMDETTLPDVLTFKHSADGTAFSIDQGNHQIRAAATWSFAGDGSLITGLNASSLGSGTVPIARFGLSAPASGHTNFLMFKSDGSYIGYDLASLLALSGGGAGLVPANNLSDVANTGTALNNLGGISTNYAPIWTNGGWFITNASGWTFQGSNGLYVDSNAVTRTAYVVTTNRNTYWMSNNVITISNNATAGNVTAIGTVSAGTVSATTLSGTLDGSSLVNSSVSSNKFDSGTLAQLFAFVSGGPIAVSSSTLDQWQNITNATDHTWILTNTVTAKWMSLGTNGVFSINGVPLLGASTLGASHHVGTDSGTNLINQEDFTGYTNSVAFTNFGTTTNMLLTFNGNLNSGLATNGPDLFPTFAAAGNGSGSWSIKYTSNITFHLPPQIKWLAGSNSVGTNGVISFTAYGGTNLVEAALKENQ